MIDHLDKLRACARQDWVLDEVRLLVSTLTAEELDRLADLRLRWPVERGWPPPRSVVRACLDRLVEGP